MPTITLYGDRSRTVQTTVQSIYSFTYNSNAGWPSSYTAANVVLPNAVVPELAGTVMTGRKNYVYFTSKSYSMQSGVLPPGSVFYYAYSIDTPNFGRSAPYAPYSYDITNVNGYGEIPDGYINNPSGRRVYAQIGGTANIYSNTLYAGNISFVVYLSHPSYPPYSVITYVEIEPTPINLSPNGGYVNKFNQNVFKYGYKYFQTGNSIGDKPKIKSAKIEYIGADGIVKTLLGDDSGCVIAPNTLPLGDVSWRCQLTTTRNITGVWSEWINLTTADTAPTSTIVSPKDTFINDYADNTLFWKHETSRGTAQHAYDLQYRQNENIDSWVNLKTHEVTQATSLLVPKGTFATGTLTWRIRTYNMDDVPGDWSVKAVVNVIGRPNAPTISAIDSTPRPTIYWNSAGQEAYQLIITKGGAEILDTKPIYGYAKLFKTPLLLDDGAYIYSLRIKNKYNIWSEFAAATTEVKNGSSLRFSLRGESVHDCAELSWSGVADALHYLVYRNETAIAKTNALYYTDLYASGENQYRVRAILAGDNYAASDTVTIKSDVTRPVLRKFSEHATQNDKLDLIMRRGEKPSHEQTNALISQAQFYTGRMLPVVQVSQFAQNDHSLSYTLKSKKELEKLLNFRGLPVAYKSKHGVVIGVITTVNVTNHYDGMPDVSFTIAETDSCLDVQYD